MKHIKSLYIALTALLLAACQTEQWENMEGGFLISLGEDVTVTTKSTPAELGKPTTDKFTLKIVKESTGHTLYEGAYTESIIPASTGFYTVTATCGDNPVLALDAPYYKGEQTGVEVTEGTEPTSVSLTCGVANALASVVYSDPEKFDDLFSSYAVKIMVSQQYVSIGKEQSTKSAYYQANTIPTFQFIGTLKDNGQEVSMLLEDEKLTDPATFAAAKHCKLTLSVKPATSGVILTVEKVEVENVTISETIPVDWLPKPKITGFEDGQTSLTYTETATAIPAQLKFTGSLAIQDVEFSFNFQDPQEKFQALNGKTFLLSQLSEEDRALFNAASIILPSLDGTNGGQFDFTAMTSNLQTLAGGADATNTINLRVKANDRWSSEEPATYEIKTIKPEFSVSVNANNCWSREFTIDEITATTGNIETLKNNLIYQYYNGTEWVECATRETVKGRTQQFNASAENIEQKTYRVRALYRGTIPSTEAEATLETPVQLPNSGMEEWHEENQSNNKNLWFPYSEGANENLWNTNNTETTNYRSESYCSTSAVKQTTNKYSGTYAAWIRTVGHGIANTNVGSLGSLNGSITGTHTIGELFYSNQFTVRPTKLIFYYHYVPNGDDAGVIEFKIENQEQGIILYETSQTVTSNSYTKYELPINYTIQDVTATHLSLTFKSGSKHTDVIKAKVRGDGANEHYGSELYIDDISLIYDK